MSVTLSVFRGNTCVIDITVSAGGTPLDLTGSDVFFVVKESFSDPDADALIIKQSGPGTPVGLIITDEVLGEAQATIDPADTIDEENARIDAKYQVHVKEADGDTFTVAEGDFIILPVTNQAQL